jgi:probable addiction module antidote protein
MSRKIVIKQMTKSRTSAWDAAEVLDTPETIAAYLEAALEENDPALLTHALGVAARAQGMGKVADEAGVTREALYKALSAEGDPKLSTLLGVLKALGLRLDIKAA